MCSAKSRLPSIPDQSRRLAALAAEKGVVNQVGYHYRFVGTFQETRRLLDLPARSARSQR